jgi:hypothetical protein
MTLAYVVKNAQGSLEVVLRNWIGEDVVALAPKDSNGRWVLYANALVPNEQGGFDVDEAKLEECREAARAEFMATKPLSKKALWWKFWS